MSIRFAIGVALALLATIALADDRHGKRIVIPKTGDRCVNDPKCHNRWHPAIPAVAKDPAVVKANPWLKPAIANVARVTRPTQLGAKYQQGSQAIYQGINQILNGQDAKNILPRIEQQLNRLLGK